MSAHNKSLFICSADHNIGHNLARWIISSEVKDCFKEIVCGGTNEQRLDDLKHLGLKVVVYRLQDRQSLVKHLKGMDVVYIVPPFMDAEPRDATHLLDACKEASVSCVLLQSIMMCDKSSEPIMKQYCELEKHLSQLQHVKHKAIVRVGALMDTFLYMAPHIQQNGEVALPIGNEKYAPIRLRDVSRATAFILSGKKQHQGRWVDVSREPMFLPEYTRDKIQLTGPQSLSGQDIVKHASSAIGAEFKFKSVDNNEAKRILMEGGELTERQVKRILEVFRLVKDGHLNHVTNDYETIVGRKPSNVDEFFEENAHNFKPRRYGK